MTHQKRLTIETRGNDVIIYALSGNGIAVSLILAREEAAALSSKLENILTALSVADGESRGVGPKETLTGVGA